MPQAIFVDTNELARIPTAEGEVTEILSEKLQGARNVLGTLRWLDSGQRFEADAGAKHQLLYFMDGKGTIDLGSDAYRAEKGMGVYLGPSETATVSAAPGETVKILHLVVPRISQ